jgi:type VI secretion system secreted protein Hcp
MPIYMEFDGIKGHITMQGHEKWIELQSFQWGVGRHISTPMGSGQDREASAPSISEVVVTKVLDAADTGLLSEALSGEGKLVKIHHCRTGKSANEPPQSYLEYELENTLVSGYSISSGGDRPMISVSLNFTKVTQVIISDDEAHKDQPAERVSWDLTKGVGG